MGTDYNIYSGAQLNVVSGNGTINATQVININIADYISTLQKRLTPNPVKSTCFVGRDDDKNILTKRIFEEHKVVLNGVGGIGKTALAKQLYFELEKEYDYIAWIDYNDNLKDSIMESMFASLIRNEHKLNNNEKYELVFQLLTNIDGKVLIVVDNFNNIKSSDLSELTRLSADILITSRCQPVGINCYTLDTPNEEDCMNIFKENYLFSESLTFEDEIAISEIIERSKRYTLLIELISKSISYNSMSISQFLDELRNQNYELNALNLSANSDWNDPFKVENIGLQISKVYKLSQVSNEEKNIIQLLSIMPPSERISFEDLKCWCTFSIEERLVNLENKGWLRREKQGAYIHEIIGGFMLEYYPILYNQCILMLDDLKNKLTIVPETNIKECVKYAEYILNVIRLYEKNSHFCRNLVIREAALLFKEVGKYNESKELLDIIISNYDEDCAENIIILAELYNNYSKVFSIESNIPKAIEKGLKAEKLLDSITEDESENYYFQRMIIKKTIGMIYAHQKKNDLALSKMDEAIESSKHIENMQVFQIANLYSDYSMLLYNIGDISGSIENYKKVISLYNKYGIDLNSPWRNTTYTNYADSLILNDQYPEAILFEYQALIGKYMLYEKENPAIANALIGMGNIYRKEKKLWDVAAVFYQKASAIYKENNSISDGYCDSIACLSIVTNNIDLAVEAYSIIKNNTSKKFFSSTYIDVMVALKEQFPDRVIEIGNLALEEVRNPKIIHVAEQYICALMGYAYYELKKYDDARNSLKEAKRKMMNESSVYYKKAKKVVEQMPALIGK